MHFQAISRTLRAGLVALLACSLLAGAEHRGQVRFGGLPLPGATVFATQGDQKKTAVTDGDGLYFFPDLADGLWKITVEMLCFEPATLEVAVQPDAPAALWDLKMLPFETIQASAPAPPPQPAVTTAIAAPAAPAPPPAKKNGKPAPAQANTPSGFQRTDVNASSDAAKIANDSAYASEAGPATDDGFLVNGSVNNGAASPFAQSGAFGNNRRGMRSLYNGSLGLTFGNSSLNARAYSLTGQDTPKPGYSHMQGVFSFGGPVRIPRVFFKAPPNFSVNYQWSRIRTANTQTTRMPTAEELAGDFSQTLNAQGQPVTLVNPLTGQAVPDNRIPQSLISPQALSLLRFFPSPNFDSGARYNYQVPLVNNSHVDALQARVGKSLGRKDNVQGIYAMQSTRGDGTNVFGFLNTSGGLGMNAQVNWMHRFTNRLIANFGYQFTRSTNHATPFFANRENVSGQAGITGNNQEPGNWGPPALVFASGIASLTDIQQSSSRNQTSSISGSLLWLFRSHNFTFGGDLRRLQFNQYSQQDARGTFVFTGTAVGSDFAGFLLGIPDTTSIAFGNADKYFRAGSYDIYFTDDWRVSPSLTINAGARWEYNSPVSELYGRLVNLDIAPGFAEIAPVLGSSPTGPLTGRQYRGSLINPDRNGVAPRIGLSWRPILGSSTIVRAGYGVYSDTNVFLPIVTRMAQQSPFSKSLNLQNSLANPLTLANGFNAPPSLIPNTFAVDPDFRVGYSQNWQLSVQRDLPRSMIMTATYLGIKGTRAQQQFLPNTVPNGAANPCPSCPTGYTYLTSNGNSTRNSGTIQLRRRLHSGFTAQVQYTLSKSIDDALLGGQGGQAVIAQDWRNLRGERGLSNFDQRHALMVQAQYTTGMGLRGGTLVGGWKGAMFKDWTIATQINAGSGHPLTPVYIAAVKGTGVTGSIRPDFTGADLYAPPPGLFLNPAALAAPASGQWGNAGRNSITGPGQFTLNASLARTFRFSDRMSADFRLDANNALNHPTYPSWNTSITSAQFGLPTTANSMRTLQSNLRVRF